MAVMVPGWAHEGGGSAMLQRIQAREGTIIEEIEKEMKNRGGPSCVLITGTHGQIPEYEGKTVEELAKSLGLSPVDTVAKVMLDCKAQVSCVYFSMSEEDVRVIMQDLNIATGSDGYSLSYDPAITTFIPHPRNFGSFPIYLQTAIRETLLPVEDVIYKITGLPAEILGLTDRGTLKTGKIADITVFDPKKVENKSTYMESRVKPAGIPHVLIGGQFALRDGVTTTLKTGRVILREKRS
jgi:N-acyl-D-amino-acid deacylase